ncbi:hypothetical protein BDV32DRAFT_106561 [Aspergillus pseudonomiae]|uniref:Uncharacterized protein n=1 Tax=Aspergillus pseudonomiae TaxID=1506151 RepID=A0A5N6HN86_9EURO|nr:uncharacterized protein BDV37DRAFT_57095 [Aspergillus pseudonomiae]KAB8255971.1 hypothetical protein BDV32DRAFT_106561 [Aspergillus pseudonomiae]KAE8406446.1 hypothetical protein BDV37DRAFT_57095 [Aspergillus pseudonomiae]
MATSPEFLVRDAGTVDGDDQFVVAAFDAAIPYLTSIGSHEQWGTTPFSHREGWVDETVQQIKDSKSSTPQSDANKNGVLRIFIVEKECHADDPESVDTHPAHYRVSSDRRRYLSVGFAFVRENWIPGYIESQKHLQVPDSERESNIYLEVMVTDSRVGSLRRGAGSALIRGIRDYGHKTQKKAFWLDGWAGNDKKLIRYYEQQGFQVVGDFSLPRANTAPWVGTLMRMDI